MLHGQLGDRLTVELNSDPTMDLNSVLDEMRCQYETVLANNRRDAEEWFTIQVSTWRNTTTGFQASALFAFSNLIVPVFQTQELNQQQLSSAEQLQGCQTEILELKRTANALEIELQAQQSLVCKGKTALPLKNQALRYHPLFHNPTQKLTQFMWQKIS